MGKGKIDGIDVLSKVSGIPKEEVNDIWKKVKENHAKLDSCVRPHDFVPINENGRLPRKYLCSKCLGVVDSVHASFYKQGLEDGSKR
jgi:hypothetical protein